MTHYRYMTDADEEKVDALWETTDIPKFPTVSPKIVADRDMNIIGFVARRNVDDPRILVEPMIAPNIFVYRRLWRCIESALRQEGAESMWFRVEPHRVAYEKALWGAEARGLIFFRGYHKGFFWWERPIR